MKRSPYFDIAAIQEMLDNGEIKVNAKGRHTMKGRHGAFYSWDNAPEDLWTTIKENTNPSWVHSICHDRFTTKKQLVLLRVAYEKLWDIAFKAGAIKFDGKPCEQCGSTNTQERGGLHMTHEGTFTEAWRDCYDCGHNEYRGDRF